MLTNLRRAELARAISAAEDSSTTNAALLKTGYARFADTRIVGVTGPPGSGKSTMVDALAALWAQQGLQVAVVAVDPSSPFSGGAVLGDRFRMRRSEDREDVFIRSVAARGHPGGLGAAVPDICIVLSAFEFDRVLLETVGSGQTDVDIKNHADTIVVTSVPGLGDAMQAAKAGIMEIGDIYAVNKADLPGADRVRADIEGMLHLAYQPLTKARGPADSSRRISRGEQMLRDRHGAAQDAGAWQPPVIATTAGTGEGIGLLSDAIGRHIAWLGQSGHFQRHRLAMQRAQLAERIWRELRQRLTAERVGDSDQLSHWAGRILAGETSIDDAVAGILDTGDIASRPARISGRDDKQYQDHFPNRRLES